MFFYLFLYSSSILILEISLYGIEFKYKNYIFLTLSIITFINVFIPHTKLNKFLFRITETQKEDLDYYEIHDQI